VLVVYNINSHYLTIHHFTIFH